MKYKALMLDVDGTLIPYDYDALPSDKVASAIKKAQEKVHICLVTGRSFLSVQSILEKLSLTSGYAVIDNGARVVEIPSNKIIYNRPIEIKDAKFIVNLFLNEKIPIYLKQDLFSHAYKDRPVSNENEVKNPYMFYTDEVLTSEKVNVLLEKLKELSNVSIIKGLHKDRSKFHLNISHAEATKLHGIEIIMKELKLKKEQIIGVGDSYNDFSLLMASGLKVAMGNGVNELKEIADYVAPSVEEDGVANVIEKFILS